MKCIVLECMNLVTSHFLIQAHLLYSKGLKVTVLAHLEHRVAWLSINDQPLLSSLLCSVQPTCCLCFFRRIEHGNWGNKEFLQLCKICESEMPPVVNIWRKQCYDTIQRRSRKHGPMSHSCPLSFASSPVVAGGEGEPYKIIRGEQGHSWFLAAQPPLQAREVWSCEVGDGQALVSL